MSSHKRALFIQQCNNVRVVESKQRQKMKIPLLCRFALRQNCHILSLPFKSQAIKNTILRHLFLKRLITQGWNTPIFALYTYLLKYLVAHSNKKYTEYVAQWVSLFLYIMNDPTSPLRVSTYSPLFPFLTRQIRKVRRVCNTHRLCINVLALSDVAGHPFTILSVLELCFPLQRQ